MKTSTEVGIRDLRDHLSKYVAEVAEGSEIVITDHGRAVARIVPLDGDRVLDRLIASGSVTPASTRARARPARRLAATGSVSELVAEQRGGR